MPAEAKRGVMFTCHRLKSQKAPKTKRTTMMRLSRRGKALARVESPRRLLMALLKKVREMPHHREGPEHQKHGEDHGVRDYT